MPEDISLIGYVDDIAAIIAQLGNASSQPLDEGSRIGSNQDRDYITHHEAHKHPVPHEGEGCDCPDEERKNQIFESEVEFVALPSITGILPWRQVNKILLKIPTNLKLADPEFDKLGQIDVLYGTSLCNSLILFERL